MKIKDKKESWLEKADIYINGQFRPNVNGTPLGQTCCLDFFEPIDIWNPNNLYPQNRIDIPEYEIGKFSSKDVNKGGFKTANQRLIPPDRSSRFYFTYEIYEYDGWPSQRKNIRFRSHEGNRKIEYRSYKTIMILERLDKHVKMLGLPLLILLGLMEPSAKTM